MADVPPEIEWFANLGNKATRRAYETALKDFMRFTGIEQPEEFRTVTRAHVIAWRDELAGRALSATTIRHRLSALASLFGYLCDQNAVTHNPVKGVKRPVPETSEGKTPALGDHQARELLAAPAGDTLKAKRDRAILATLLYHALRRDELCKLKVKDYRQERRGVPQLTCKRFIPDGGVQAEAGPSMRTRSCNSVTPSECDTLLRQFRLIRDQYAGGVLRT
jgi:integrase/recombinase XerD